MAVKWTRVKPGQRALDVCCGSGDLAVLLADAVGPAGRVTGLDFAADMLQVGGCMCVRTGFVGGGQLGWIWRWPERWMSAAAAAIQQYCWQMQLGRLDVSQGWTLQLICYRLVAVCFKESMHVCRQRESPSSQCNNHPKYVCLGGGWMGWGCGNGQGQCCSDSNLSCHSGVQ